MSNHSSSLYIGLMSGTSMDGVDGVLASIYRQRPDRHGGRRHILPFSDALRGELMALQAAGRQ